MEIKRIADLPVVKSAPENGHVLIEDGGYAKRIPVDDLTAAKMDYSAFGIPVLELIGDISAMSKDNKVALSYVYGDKTGMLSCKWQGSSSLAYPKKNYTVEFDKAFEAKTGWGTQKKYCLKANWVDASNMRNILGAKMWGQLVKERSGADERLKALPNGGAIDGFPIWVTINGDPMGLYTMNIPKEAWLFGMTGENGGEGYVCADRCTLASAVTGTAAEDGVYDVKIEYAASDESALLASLNNMISVVNAVNASGDMAALEAVVDVNSVIDYYCLMVYLSHKDGISRNYILATYDGAKWFMSAYDMDGTFGNNWDGKQYFWPNVWPMFDNGDGSGLTLGMNNLLDVVRKYYGPQIKARYQAVRDWSWGEINMNTIVYNMALQFPNALVDEDFRLWPGRPGTLTNNAHQILDWLRIRGASLDWNVQNIV